MAQNGSSLEQHAGRAARKASPWIGRLARVGYVAYGVVYVLVGGDRATGQEGALRQVLLAPLGKVLLGVIVVGLLAYAAWRLFQGFLGPEGRSAKGVVRRFDHGINGVFHAALAFSAGQHVSGSGGGGGGSPDDWTARQPFGPYILGVVALGLAAYGGFMFVVTRYRRIEPV